MNLSKKIQLFFDKFKGTGEFNKKFCIEEGGYGKVFKAQLSQNNIVAVKRLHSSSSELMEDHNGFFNEIRALPMKIKHKNVAKLLNFCLSDQHSFLMYDYYLD